jgi:predicted GIY-YIG superfamily endonuclease
MATESTPPGLKPSRGLRSIENLAQQHNKPGRAKKYRLYVIEVTDCADVDFYVGQTSRKVETRLAQHQSRSADQHAAKLFKKNRGTAHRLRYDLFEGLPYFTEKETSVKAEGILADVIKTQLEARVDCDALRARERERRDAGTNSGPMAVKASPPAKNSP